MCHLYVYVQYEWRVWRCFDRQYKCVCVWPAMRAGGWRCGGPGRATGDTARVYTSAGDCIEGVSSAGGVKSISSSKWSSNSCIVKNKEWIKTGRDTTAHMLHNSNLNSQTLSITIHPHSVFIRSGPHGSRWSCACLATCLPRLSPWSWSPSPCSRSRNSLATPPRPQAPSETPPGTGRETQTTCPLCFHLKWEKQTLLNHFAFIAVLRN